MGQVARKVMIDNPSPDDLVEQYQQYVHSIATKMIAGMHLPASQLDEYVAAGNLGLVEAAQRYDASSRVDFRNFSYLRIRGAIIDSIRANSELSGKAYKMSRAWFATQALEESYFLTGTQHLDGDQELAELLEFAASGALAFKLSMCDVEEEVAELIGSDLSQEENMIESQESIRLRKLIEKLPEKEQLIIRGYYFEQKTFSDLAYENEGMTKSWISRLHARALSHLREFYLAEGGDPREK